MAIPKIARMGHLVAHEPAAAVAGSKAPEIHALARDMFETPFDAQGAGLAAPRLYVPLQLALSRNAGAGARY